VRALPWGSDKESFVKHRRLRLKWFDDSVAALSRAAELSGDFPLVLGRLGLALGSGGHADEARSVLNHLHTMPRELFVPPTSL
jgi:hypothetical protein